MSARVALCLAVTAHLELLFQAATRAENKQLFLQCAADCIDRTRPRPEIQLRALHWDGQNQVAFLIKNRDYIDEVPVAEWPKRRVRPSQWPALHASAIRTFERLLKGEAQTIAAKTALLAWLAPVFEVYPELEDPISKYLIGPSSPPAN